MRKTWILLTAALVVAAMVGCAKPPQADVDAAKASVEAAKAAGAGEYAPSSLSAAEDAVAQLDAELTAQQGKFALTRSYKHSTELATAAKAAGDKAATDAAAGKEAAKNEAAGLITQAQAALEEAKALLDKAPKGKGTQADIEAMKADLAGVESTIAEANSAMGSQHYLQAKAKAQSALTAAGNVKAAVEQAMEAKKGTRH